MHCFGMETTGFVFGLMGFCFGLTGVSFAIISWGQITSLRKEFESMKKRLEDSGVLKEQAETEG
mgnify:CR=1 FL=1|jgi:hypothetical protein